MTSSPLRIGIAGLGTVGGGALKILAGQAALLEQRCGRKLEIAGISARDRTKNRGADVGRFRWFDDPLAMAADPNIEVIVEAIGGAEGVARALVEKALAAGKPVVTANKALIAHHGVQLAALAEKHDAVLAFEAAVAGGIPIIKALRDGLSANRFTRIAGILNGTCNYILSSMREEKRGFDEVLAEAQAKGYAEADPGFDIDGIDSAHKIAILAGLAYGAAPDIENVRVEGIRGITPADMEFAASLGYAVKLVAIAELTENGLMQRVHPCLLAQDSPLASVNGVYNAVMVEGDAVGTVLFEGRGAGEGPTASSVVADVMDIARGVNYRPFTLPAAALKPLPAAPMAGLRSAYYLRLNVADKSGVLAEITGVFKNENISLRSVLQHSQGREEATPLMVVTHEAGEAAMQKALAALSRLGSVQEKPYMLRIEPI